MAEIFVEEGYRDDVWINLRLPDQDCTISINGLIRQTSGGKLKNAFNAWKNEVLKQFEKDREGEK